MDNREIKVLLVEDSRIAQRNAVMTLQEFNCNIDIADTGTQALKFINENQYDLVFMDLGLGDIDGLTVTIAIRNTDECNKNVPIIALTAHTDEDIKASCLKIGIDDFIAKPIEIERAREVFDKFIHKSH